MAETRLADYLGFLLDLGSSGADYFLEGGQAVNFWAEYYSAKGNASVLSTFAPFTSKDCDIWASYALLQYLRRKCDGGRLITGTSPADGQVGVFRIAGHPELVVDILSNVYGIAAHRLDRLKARALRIEGIRVMDPLFLFQSKCHCLLGLDQSARQDERHVRMLCHIVPEHLLGLLEQTMAGNLTERALISELKLLQTILKTQPVKRALELVEVAPAVLIPVERLRACGLEKVEQFAARSLG